MGRIFASEIWGTYRREGLFLGGLLSEFYGLTHECHLYNILQELIYCTKNLR